MTTLFALLLQTWHELKFDLGGPEDVESFPWSVPVSVAVALAIVFVIWRARRNYLALPELPAVESSPEADVTVVIPARNDERTIAMCVKSLWPYRVVVVDDKSRDRTVAEAVAAGAEVIPAPPAPRGVLPRPSAYCAGAQTVITNYVMFADADTTFEKNFVASVMRYAAENELVLLSPFLNEECRTAMEKLLTPFATAVSYCGLNAIHAQDVLKPSTFANGQCMFFLRSAYEFFGGYRSVQTSGIEDVAIAQKVKRHRMKLRIMRAEHLGSVHRGWSRRSAARVLRPSGDLEKMVILCFLLLASIAPITAWLAWQEQWAFIPVLLVLPAVAFSSWYGSIVKGMLYLPAAYILMWMIVREYVASVFGFRRA